MDPKNPKGEHIASSPIFKNFLGKAEEYLKKPSRLKNLLNEAYQKASDKKDIGTLAHEAWETMQTLFRLIRMSASGEYTGLPTPTVVAAVAVVAYFLFPIDLIPDFIPVIGLLDDIALVAWFSTSIKAELDKFEEWEKTHVALVPGAAHPGAQAASAGSPAGADSGKHTFAVEDASEAKETTESAKKAGTTNLKSTPDGPSAPSSPASYGDVKPHADATANTTDGSRTRNDGPADTGGNIR